MSEIEEVDPITQDLINRFKFHPATDETTKQAHEKIREECLKLAMILKHYTIRSREQSLAYTHLEECMFWANAAIARNK